MYVFRADREDTTSIPNDEIVAIAELPSGIMWIGTAGGSYLYDDDADSIVACTTNDGLPGEIIYSCISDQYNDLWLGTNNGLRRYNRAENRIET